MTIVEIDNWFPVSEAPGLLLEDRLSFSSSTHLRMTEFTGKQEGT